LTTTLLTLGLTKPQIQARLLLFSLSAPVGAVVTYMIVKAVGGGQGEVPDDAVDLIGWWTGVVLLFSVSTQGIASFIR
jgi:zinc transporter 9